MLALTVRSVDRVAEWTVRRTFADAGITLDGREPWDIRVRDRALYRRLLRNPAFQIGETYLEGMWECEDIAGLMFRLMTSGVASKHERDPRFHLRTAWAKVRNPQSRARARDVATTHYDLDVELYTAMLDSALVYTCGVWDDATTLDEAQRAKLDLVCRRLQLAPGQRLLDIGCGFGGLAAHAATHYGVDVVGITNSRGHAAVARERCAGLPVEIVELDYRDLARLGRFDAVSSIEMIEAVGPKNYGEYMALAHGALRDGGRLLVQTFISDDDLHVCNEWFDRYIFPNGVSPSLAQLAVATASTFGPPIVRDDMTRHYPPTLVAWDERLRAAWPRLSRRYDRRFQRMWHFYLACLAGVFGAEDLHLYQLVWSR